jgi:hypothetical protein
MRHIGVAVAAIALTACGGGADDANEPAYVESEQCRQQASEALDVVALGLEDRDVRDLAGRLDTLDGMTPEAFAQCTADVTRPGNEAVAALGGAFDAATQGGDVALQLASATNNLEEAREALEARR